MLFVKECGARIGDEIQHQELPRPSVTVQKKKGRSAAALGIECQPDFGENDWSLRRRWPMSHERACYEDKSRGLPMLDESSYKPRPK